MENNLVIMDKTTGEIFGEYKPKNARKKHIYFLVFHKNLAQSKANITPAMLAILGEMDRNNLIIMSSDLREKLSKYYNITQNAIKVTLTKMCRNNLAIRTGQSVYMANPFYYTKTNINKLNELKNIYSQITFSRPQRTSKKKDKLTGLPDYVIPLKEAK